MQNNPFLIYRRKDGRLGTKVVSDNGEEVEAILTVSRCFPWTAPDEYVSLRDENDREVYLLEHLDDVQDSNMRQLILEELHERTYLPNIIRIDAIVDEIDLFRWQVMTTAGYRVLYLRRREIPRELPGEGVMLKDIAGDRYVIPRIESLDPKSRNWLWLYLD